MFTFVDSGQSRCGGGIDKLGCTLHSPLTIFIISFDSVLKLLSFSMYSFKTPIHPTELMSLCDAYVPACILLVCKRVCAACYTVSRFIAI